MMWEPGASIRALAIHGFVSTSPMPVMLSSVWTRTTMVSCEESHASGLQSGARRTVQSTAVIFIASVPLSEWSHQQKVIPVRDADSNFRPAGDDAFSRNLFGIQIVKSVSQPARRKVLQYECKHVVGLGIR